MNNLNEIIRIFGLTKEKVALDLGYTSRKIVTEWTTGRKEIADHRKQQLKEYFEIPIDFLYKELAEKDKLFMYQKRISKEFGKDIVICSK